MHKKLYFLNKIVKIINKKKLNKLINKNKSKKVEKQMHTQR